MNRKFIALSASLILAAEVAGQTAKQLPPPPGPVRPFAFPKYQTKKLANGLTVFAIEDHRQPVVSYTLEITTAGASVNPPKQAGLAGFDATLLRQGTKTRTAQQIASLVDSSGGSLDCLADQDNAIVESTMVKSYADLGIQLLADITLNPSFPQDEIDRLLRQSLSALQVQYTDPAALVQYLADRIGYGNHPYGLPAEGTPSTLKNFKRDDVVQFYQTHYGPAGSYLAIAGDVSPDEAFALAEKYFGAWKADIKIAAFPKASASPVRRIVIVDKPDAVQTQYGILQLSIPRNDPDYIPLMIANQIFGGSFNSRLNMKLRAAEGLTYGASSRFVTLKQSGLFAATSFSRTDKTATAIKLIDGLLKEFHDNPATEPELKEAKAYLAGSFVLSIETPSQVASRVLSAAVNNLPPSYWDNYRDAILATTQEQIVAAVKRHLTPEKMDIIAVGNAGQFAKDLEPLGQVQIIPLSDFDVTSADLRRPKDAAPVTAESKARAAQWVQQAIEAIGGRAALDAVQNLDSTGDANLTMGGQTFKAESEEVVLYPDRYRMNLKLPIGPVTQAYDGKVMWMQQGPNTRELPPDMGKEVRRSIQLAAGVGLLRLAAAGTAEVSAIEPVDLEGKKMNAATWKLDDQSVRVLFDPETKRIARLSYRGTGMGGPADLDVTFADYRPIGKLSLPFAETVYQNGQKFAERTYTERKINGEVRPESFSKP